MLNVLQNLNSSTDKEGLLFFICEVIGNKQITIRDAEIKCARSSGKRYYSVFDLIKYCQALGWVQEKDGIISLVEAVASFINDKDTLNNVLVESTITYLFQEGIFDPRMFYYDPIQRDYFFKNELLPLSLSGVRNMLISQGFLIPERIAQSTCFHVDSSYDALIAEHCKKRRRQLTLKQLKKQLENNEIAGEKAELFALEFEKKRLGLPLSQKVKRISDIDATAGYDIVSFCSPQSKTTDRFIEVKAVSARGFHWSNNEYKIAKLYGNRYYLYLVDLRKITEEGYSPVVISNPAYVIDQSNEWLKEPESYYVRRA